MSDRQPYRVPPGLERALIPRPFAMVAPWTFESIFRPTRTMPWEPGWGDLPNPPMRWRVLHAEVGVGTEYCDCWSPADCTLCYGSRVRETMVVRWREILLVDRLRELGFNLATAEDVATYLRVLPDGGA